MKFEEHLPALIVELRKCKFSSDAKPFFELMSGGLVWDDERISGLEPELLGCLRGLFRYRSSLIEQSPDERFSSLWNIAKQDCPEWIGFREDRCSAGLAETMVALRGR